LGVIYYAINAGTSTFQLSLQRGGTAITVGSTGTAVKAISLNDSFDTIYILPAHVENISSATALNVNVAGTKIIGLGIDENRPTFYLDTGTTTTITVSVPCVSINNIIIDGTGFAAIASMVTITAAATDVEFNNCKFIHANSTNQAGIVLTATTAHRFKFNGNRVIGSGNSGTTNALQLIGSDDVEIRNNYFFGNYTTSLGPINNITTGCARILIENNTLINNTASSTKAIVLVAGTTGMIRNNSIGILSGTAPITGAGIWVSGNYYAAATGVSASVLI
jgi:hypothetical protein